MTKPEAECFNALMSAVGSDYYIFPQVHLSTFLNHRVKGQSWRGALSSIQRKSIDFLICEKRNIVPRLAIELDDRSHQAKDRVERDKMVEEICFQAGIPLLRIDHAIGSDIQYLKSKIHSMIIY